MHLKPKLCASAWGFLFFQAKRTIIHPFVYDERKETL